MKVKLTVQKVRDHRCPAGKAQDFLWDTEVRGLAVRALADRVVGKETVPGAKSYIFQGRIKGEGKEVRVTLGRADELPLTGDDTHEDEARHGARARARTLRRLLELGRNPLAEKQEALAAKTAAAERQKAEMVSLRTVAAHYVANKKTKHGPLKPKTVSDINRHIDTSFAAWADKSVKHITRNACEARYKELSEGGLHGKRAAPAQATQAFVTLRALLNWAQEKYRVGGKPIIEENPVRVLKGTMHPAKVRTGKVPIDRVGAAWVALRERREDEGYTASHHTGADAVMFLLLTGARIGEGTGLTWDRVDVGEASGTWHLPTPKNGNPVWLPLSAPARALLAARPRTERNPHVFQARTGKGHMVDVRGPMDVLSEAAGIRLTPHDLRRTFISIGIKLGIEMWKLELLTNHVPASSSVTLMHYTERSDLRYLAPEVECIGAFIVEQGAVAAAGNVVQLRAWKNMQA
jgi:integrase